MLASEAKQIMLKTEDALKTYNKNEEGALFAILEKKDEEQEQVDEQGDGTIGVLV